MTFYIQTFGCQANEADSERIASYLRNLGLKKAIKIEESDWIIINTCMIRKMAEDRIYGLIQNLKKLKVKTNNPKKIILTGCIVGMAIKDKTGKYLEILKEKLPDVDEFLPIEEIGFNINPLRNKKDIALIPISNGCNNFCSFCVVPYSRGVEISRSYEDILSECKKVIKEGYKKIMLLGMNVNSYGSDIINKNDGFFLKNGRKIKPIMVTHLGKKRIPTLFPHLLSDIGKIPEIEYIDFMSANPWDFSDELIKVIEKNPKITRKIHLAVQSGNNNVLRRMNRWYTKEEYLILLKKIKNKIPNIQISTDIIVGFCGETEEEFKDTIDLVKKANFYKAYISMYSDRPMTVAHKNLKDDVSYKIKKQRWQILENLINKSNLN